MSGLSVKNLFIFAGLLAVAISAFHGIIWPFQKEESYNLSAAGGNNYYVATTGSDSNAGTELQPWRTIQKAANTMTAGDTVIVFSGNFDERVHVSISGSSGAPITYLAEGTVTMKGFTVRADYVTIRGFEIADTDFDWTDGVGIFVEGSYCIIEDNYVHDSANEGIKIFANPGEETTRTDCQVRSNRLYRNTIAGIEINGRNHLVESNEIWGTIQYNPKWPDHPSWVDADGMRFFGSWHLIRKNYIHDITFDDPENVDPHIDCFQTWGDAQSEAGHNIIFEQNRCKVLESQAPNENGTAFMLAGARNLIIRNNILQVFHHVNTGSGGNSNLIIVNNTLTSDLAFPLENYPEGVSLDNCPNSTVKNNIFYDLPAHIIRVIGTSTLGLNVGRNLAYRSDGQPLWGSPYTNDLWGVDPLFIDAANDNFHLQPSSPAIDVGYYLGSLVSEDFDGIFRPQRINYDIGAFEYFEGNGPPDTRSFIYLPIIFRKTAS